MKGNAWRHKSVDSRDCSVDLNFFMEESEVNPRGLRPLSSSA